MYKCGLRERHIACHALVVLMLISCHRVVSLTVFYNSKASPYSPLPSVLPRPVIDAGDEYFVYIISQRHRERDRQKIEQVDLGSMDSQVEVKKVQPSSACPALAQTGQID